MLAQRAQVSNAEMWAWHQHVTDTVGKRRLQDGKDGKDGALTTIVPSQASPVTTKLYQFLLKELSCEVCSGRLCRCCFSFCGVCEQLHCKTCSADCVRCEDCLAFFDTADWCAECGDDFCGCARDALHCDNCKESLCSKCASIFPCFNCRRGYCLIKSENDDEITGCAIRHSLWMCPDCRSVGYCKAPPQDHTAVGGQTNVHGSCMEYGSIECEVCKLRVCLSCANASATSPSGAASCPRCGTVRSARLKQMIKMRLKRIEEGCRCKQCMQKRLEKKAAICDKRCAADSTAAGEEVGAVSAAEGKAHKSKAADDKAKADAAAKAFKELMQMEEKEVEKKKEEEPILGPMLNVCVRSKSGTVTKGGGDDKAAPVFTGNLTFGWSEGKGARRVQVRLDGNEQRVLKIADSETAVTLPDVVLPLGKQHVASLRAARAKGPWCAWSAEISFGLDDVEGTLQGALVIDEKSATADDAKASKGSKAGAKAAVDTDAGSAQKKSHAAGAAGPAAQASGKESKQPQPADKSKSKDKAAGAGQKGQKGASAADAAAVSASSVADKAAENKAAAKGKAGKGGKGQKDDKGEAARKESKANEGGNKPGGGAREADKPPVASGAKAAAAAPQKKGAATASKKNAPAGAAGKAAAAAAAGKQPLGASSSESEDGGGDEEDDDALLRLAALSVSNRPGAAKKKDAGQKGANWSGSDPRRDDAHQSASYQPSLQPATHTQAPPRGGAVAGNSGAQAGYGGGALEGQQQMGGAGAGGGGGSGSPGSHKMASEASNQHQQQMAHLAHLHGHIVMSCNIEPKERGSIIGVRFVLCDMLRRRL